MALHTIHLFAGAGGGILADLLLGHTPICAVEIEEYPRRVLLQRQLDGVLPAFPIWDDVCTFRQDNPGCADFFNRAKSIRDNLAICGGFPCQDISSAGKGAGIDGERSGLWKEFARIIGEVRPRFVFVENSPILTSRGLGVVLGDLAAMGYDAEWGVLGGNSVGCVHSRERIFILAYRPEIGFYRDRKEEIYRLQGKSPWEGYRRIEDIIERPPIHSPRFCRVDDGVPDRVDRTCAVGNAQIPGVASLAWKTLKNKPLREILKKS